MRLDQIVVDSLEPGALARFWAELLGGVAVEREDGWAQVRADGFPVLAFQPVPEGKGVKNRLHLDVFADDVRAATASAARLGAVVVGGLQVDEHGTFQVLRDPQGNEFCFVDG
ncbi:VOC family protein [Actinosynnema sp. NPDC020468]|uniref:VOC family protein n=1 Tax=Actinosynnema sp. NPDC020468 TaxID=3154488 RepID=UPI003404FB2F